MPPRAFFLCLRCVWPSNVSDGGSRSAYIATMARNDSRSFIAVRIAVLTISDSRSFSDDTSGQTLADRIAEAGHELSARKIVKDDIRSIRSCMRDWINRN